MNNKKTISKRPKSKNFNLETIELKKMNNLIPSSVSFFPSGNMISSTWTGDIKIYDINYTIIQTIEHAHDEPITYLTIKDENNFISCSYDKSIRTWIKEDKNFILNQIIIKAHKETICKVIYMLNDNLISFSEDETVKIWEYKNKYQSVSVLKYGIAKSGLLLEDKNKLIFSGSDGTFVFNLINYEFLFNFKKVKCFWWNAMCRIDDDKIIIGATTLIIISISKKEIIKNIKLPFVCFTIVRNTDQGVFYIAGYGNDIMIYRSDNFQYIHTIKNAHDKEITGLTLKKNKFLVSYSNDDTIKIWSK